MENFMTHGPYEVLLHNVVWAHPLLPVGCCWLRPTLSGFTVALCNGAFAQTTLKNPFYEPGIEHITMLGTLGLTRLLFSL